MLMISPVQLFEKGVVGYGRPRFCYSRTPLSNNSPGLLFHWHVI